MGRLQRTAYGRTTVVDGSTESTQLRFPGQYEDPETGLHYNRFRYYDPDTGRYLSPDPIGFDGGHDLFGYGPNPIGYYDPMGWARKRRKTNAGAKSGGKGIKSETQDQTPGELQSTEKSPLDRKTPPEDAVEAAEVATEGTYPACKCCGKGGSRKRKKKRKKKYPGKTKPRPPARAKTEPSNRERRIAARPGNSPRQRAAREKVVRDFMAKKGLGSKHADDALGVHPVTGEANKHPDGYGIDISKPVKVVTLPPPKQVSQHVSSNHGNPGNYFDGKGGQTPDELGIRGDNRHSRTFDVPDKDPKIEALQSANGPVVDRWTRDPSGKPYPPKKTPGGGEQLTIGNDDIKSFACSICHQSPPYKPPCTCPNP